MRKTFRLNAANSAQSIDIDFEAVAVVVNNPTGSPVFLRVGSPDIPTETNADLFVPAGESLSYPVTGYSFAATFGQVAALASAAAALSGLFQTCIITFLGAGETIPSYGSASFLSLSISELKPITAYAGTTTSAAFDIGAWGGALVYANPDAASGQAVLAVEVSNTGVAGSWAPLGTYAIWPNVPSIVTVPRVARYFRLTMNTTTIPAEPAISGSYAVRASMEEVQSLTYNPSGTTITKAYNLASLGSQQWMFVTVGLPAVSIAAIATAGTGAASAITFLVEASSDLVNWRQVTARDQKMSSGITLYRALGNLDIFIRVTIFEIGGAAQVGSLYLSTPREPDLGYILNTIQQSIGDNKAPANTRQDVYHELESIYQTDVASGVSLSSIDGKLTTTNTDLGLIHNDLVTVNTNLGTIHTDLSSTIHSDLSTINTTIGATNTALGTVNTNLGTIHTDLSTTIHTDLGTINTNITGVNSNLIAISTQLTAANTAQSKTATPVVGQAAGIASGTLTNVGLLLPAGWWIQTASISWGLAGAPTSPPILSMAYGTNLLAAAPFYQNNASFYTVVAGQTTGQGIVMPYGSNRSPGVIIPAGNTWLWVACSDGALGRSYTLQYSISVVQ